MKVLLQTLALLFFFALYPLLLLPLFLFWWLAYPTLILAALAELIVEWRRIKHRKPKRKEVERRDVFELISSGTGSSTASYD